MEGYVVEREICTICPANKVCAACEPSLIVSRERNPRDRTMTGDGNLKVIVSSVKQFAVGARVKLEVEATARQPFQGDPCCARVGPYVVRVVE